MIFGSFLDTKVQIHAALGRGMAPQKRIGVRELVRDMSFVTPAQVLQTFCVNAIRITGKPLSNTEDLSNGQLDGSVHVINPFLNN